MDAKPLHSVYLWLHEKQASYRVVLNNYFTFFKIIKAVSVSGRASVGGPAVPAGLQDPHVPSLPLRRFRGDGWKPGTRGARSPGIACSCMVAQGPRSRLPVVSDSSCKTSGLAWRSSGARAALCWSSKQ